MRMQGLRGAYQAVCPTKSEQAATYKDTRHKLNNRTPPFPFPLSAFSYPLFFPGAFPCPPILPMKLCGFAMRFATTTTNTSSRRRRRSATSSMTRKLVRLKSLEAAHPEWITADSPTQRVGGAPVEGLTPVETPHPDAFDRQYLQHRGSQEVRRTDGQAAAARVA